MRDIVHYFEPDSLVHDKKYTVTESMGVGAHKPDYLTKIEANEMYMSKHGIAYLTQNAADSR